ncbi:SMK-1 domain-containing protein [Mycena indigotica]|uniref:SMK-1 domain-containing protein n=1 Tax=Mycena indigotica TaxID=2126181 RepID=A0A8H6SLT6_9AGAR|nr:SMK-1 domain-containing protein [Mycena indigotica]KAF7302120.1 SMK-1 domain-containing protein [Mycena indigotica]
MDSQQIAGEKDPQDTLAAGHTESEAPADTLPSSSPPPPDEENPAVAPSSTVSNDEAAIHTSELTQNEPPLNADDGRGWLPPDQDIKRVKVYELVGQRWVDQGTAFCFGEYQEETEQAHLIARSERNFADVILSTPIRASDVYQRQQDTLIVWTEPNGADYALSFQDPEGCLEVWNFICEVQQHITGLEATRALSSSPDIDAPVVTTPQLLRSGQLPPPKFEILIDIERAVKGLPRQSAGRERICEHIMQVDYIGTLIQLFKEAVELDIIDNLLGVSGLLQAILLLNDHNLYEHIITDELFPDILSILEYEPEFPMHKANYREFIEKQAHFHQPIPLNDATLQRKIHHTYRLQFLKDVVLARVLDDSTFNVLNSCIIFNQIDIINHIQADHGFLRDVVKLYVDEEMLVGASAPRKTATTTNGTKSPPLPPNELPNSNGITPSAHQPRRSSGAYAFAPPEDLTPEEIRIRREVVYLLQSLCALGKNIQLPARMQLFRTLVDRAVLFAVQWALGLPENDPESRSVLSAGGEILTALLDHDAYGVRSHVLKQVGAIEKERSAGKRGADKAETLAELVCGIVAKSQNVAIQSQLGDALKVFLEVPPPGDTGPPLPPSEASPGGIRASRKDEPGNERFLEYFYRDCVTILFRPLLELPEWKYATDPILSLTREETNRFTYLCDLLYNFISGHNFRGYFYVASSQILSRVPTLFKARDKHLQHAAFRIFRLLLRTNNGNMHTLVMKHDLLKPILDLTMRESRRDNLLSCSCHEYFDYMRRENVKDLIKFCMTRHEEDIRRLAETPLGKDRYVMFIRRWEINNEPPPPESESKPEKPSDNPRWQAGQRVLDAEEEDYFNTEDEDDYIPPISHQQWVRSLGGGASRGSSPIPNLKRKRRMGSIGNGLIPLNLNVTQRSTSPSLGQLMDYGEDDDDAIKRRPSPTPSEDGDGPLTPPATDDDDEEDNMLEALVRTKSAPGPPRLAKRRRTDGDDDDEMLERLTKTSKKQDSGALNKGGARTLTTKSGDDPPPLKKLKLKFGIGVSSVVQAATAAVTDLKNGAKDGDTG